MKIKVSLLRRILNQLSEATGFMQDFSGFREMTEMIGFQNSHYLYKKVHQEIVNKNDNDEIGLSRFHVNKIAKFLGFKSYHELESSLNNTLQPQLISFVGSYYCYVRANLTEGLVFRSPVRILIKNNKVVFELKGPSVTYKGEVSTRNGCLFILMTSKEGKVFHHIYKTGERHHPEVLQGIFSGVSTAFDPIGGRTVLVRQESDFDSLTNKRTKTSVMKKSKQEQDRAVAGYFSHYNNNNVAPNKSSTFSFNDLS